MGWQVGNVWTKGITIKVLGASSGIQDAAINSTVSDVMESNRQVALQSFTQFQ